GLALRAVGALDLRRADMLLVPGASGRVGENGEVPDEEPGADAAEWKQDEFIPVLLGRTLNTGLPVLLRQA
ncbi:DJ-1/PfpI family protein, partial [Streptomyces sp. SID11233]|nr:DJ-1/PfpI family protein [Streptomyces sp. SID11233]